VKRKKKRGRDSKAAFSARWDQAREEGRSAFERGQSLGDCPHKNALKGAWVHGWKERQREKAER
jgi:hypothetical protein